MSAHDRPESSDPLVHRADEGRLASFLDALDEKDAQLTSPAAASGKRWPYRRASLQLTVEGETGPRSSLRVHTRAINERYLWTLSMYFIYPGSYCSLTLLTTHNMWDTVSGLVTHCRYVGDGVHEIELRLDQPIEVGLYVPQAIRRHVLVVDDEEMSRSLITLLLGKLNADSMAVAGGEEAVKAVQEGVYDLVLLDLAMPKLDGFGTLEALRQAGYQGTVVALTALDGPDQQEQCLAVGFDGFVAKPVTRDKLERELQSLNQEPMYSALADDPSLTELISKFVADLRPSSNAMQIALRIQDWEALAQRVRSLKANAGGLGFDSIADKAQQLEKALHEDADPQTLARQIRELVSLCSLARAATVTHHG